LTLVTWQRLFRLLNEPGVAQGRWATDLRAYLELCGLDAFESIGRRVEGPQSTLLLSSWRAQRPSVGLRDVVSEVCTNSHVGALRFWRSRDAPRAGKGGLRRLHPLIIDRSASHTILRWRSTGGSRNEETRRS
jgi:hypothetical protein